MIIGTASLVMVFSGVNNSKNKQLKNTKLKIKNLSNGLKNKLKLADKSATIVLGKSFRALRRPEYLGAWRGYKPLYLKLCIMELPSCTVRRAYRTCGPALKLSSLG